jgi:hypothetical protein
LLEIDLRYTLSGKEKNRGKKAHLSEIISRDPEQKVKKTKKDV